MISQSKSSKEARKSGPEATHKSDDGASANEFSFWDQFDSFESDLMPDVCSDVYLEFYQAVAEQEKSWAAVELVKLPPSPKFDAEIVADASILASIVGPHVPCNYTPRADEHLVAASTGDDNLAFGNQPAESIMKSVMSSRLFNMVVSVKDSGLNLDFGNYTEKFIMMPRDRLDLIGATKLRGGDRTTPVLDIASMRSLLPVDGQVKSNVSSLEGKMAIVARALSFSKRAAEELINGKISIIQDVLLGSMTNSDKFPYLPESVGGLNKPFPFHSVENVERAVFSWKRGRYARLLIYVIQASNRLIGGDTFVREPFLERVKSTYDGYNSWYVNYKRNLPIAKGMLPPWASQFQMGAFSHDAVSNAVLRRLRAARVIVSERDLIVAAEVEDYTRSMLTSSVEDFRDLKEKRMKEYLQQTTHARSFNSLYNEYVTADLGSSVLSKSDKDFALEIDLNTTLKVRNFFFNERFYDREALDSILIRGPHKVNFPLLLNGRVFQSVQREDVGIETPCGDEDLVVELFEWATGERSNFPPRRLLEDDDVLMSEVLSFVKDCPSPIACILLVSGDFALARKMNVESQAVVVSIPPRLVIAMTQGLVDFGQDPGKDPSLAEVFANLRGKLKSLSAGMGVREVVRANLVRVDTGNWEKEATKLDFFPFEKPSRYDETKVNHLEFRTEKVKGYDVPQVMYDRWPFGGPYVHDCEGITNARAMGGNPSLASSSSNWRSKDSRATFQKGMMGRAFSGAKGALKATKSVLRKMPSLALKRASTKQVFLPPPDDVVSQFWERDD